MLHAKPCKIVLPPLKIIVVTRIVVIVYDYSLVCSVIVVITVIQG